MGEIVQVNIGQCGNQIGAKYLDMVWEEEQSREIHFAQRHISDDGASESESASAKFIPRAVCIDLEPGTFDDLRQHRLRFNEERFVRGLSGAGNNWAKGHYTEGAEIVDSAMDALRKEAEGCSHLQGFHLVHSIGGGTGGGMGSLVLEKLREEYPETTLTTTTLFPSNYSDSVVEPYNTVLSMRHLTEYADSVLCIDCNALYDVLFRVLKYSTPTYSDVDALTVAAMSGAFCSLRCGSRAMRDLVSDLVVHPRLHFLMTSFAPLSREFAAPPTPDGLLGDVFDPRRLFVQGVKRHQTGWMTADLTVRGNGGIGGPLRERIGALQLDATNTWLPRSIAVRHCPIQRFYMGSRSDSASLLGNGVPVAELFRHHSEMFSAMFRRKAFLHWYQGEGMDEFEFAEAQTELLSLIFDYQQHRTSMAE